MVLSLNKCQEEDKRCFVVLGQDLGRVDNSLRFLLSKNNKLILWSDYEVDLNLLVNSLKEEIYLAEDDLKTLMSLSRVKIIFWTKKDLTIEGVRSVASFLVHEDFERAYKKDFMNKIFSDYERNKKYIGFDFEQALEVLNKCYQSSLVLGKSFKNVDLKKILPKVKKIFLEKNKVDHEKVFSVDDFFLEEKDTFLCLGLNSNQEKILHEMKRHEGLKFFFGEKLGKEDVFDYQGFGHQSALHYLIEDSLPVLE